MINNFGIGNLPFIGWFVSSWSSERLRNDCPHWPNTMAARTGTQPNVYKNAYITTANKWKGFRAMGRLKQSIGFAITTILFNKFGNKFGIRLLTSSDTEALTKMNSKI